jgi:ABC-type Fe3+-hydroxamate transport system substrate-binding protein
MARVSPRFLLAFVLLLLVGCKGSPAAPVEGPRRIVSLSPGITEALYALGAGGEVVGLSQYVSWPPEAASVPKVGSTLAPNYEAIARLKPTLIIDERVKQAPAESLAALAPLKVLPWLTVDDMVQGLQDLGRLTGREAAARQLSERVGTTLKRPPPPDAPRTLLVLGDPGGGTLSSVWYMRRRTLQGAALEAAGAHNAVEEDVAGPPNLALERLIAVDPDVILVLLAQDRLTPEEEARQLAVWKRLSVLRAVRQGRVKLVHGPGVQSTGPRILDLVDQLRAALGTGPRAP